MRARALASSSAAKGAARVRKWWGISLLSVVLLGALSFDARSDGLVGGAGSNQGGFDPSKMLASQNALVLSNDPMQGVEFNRCAATAQAIANAQSFRNPDMSMYNPDTILQSGAAMGVAALGSGLAGAFAGSNGPGVAGAIGSTLFGATGSCAGQTLVVPKVGTDCGAYKINDKFNSVKLDADMMAMNQTGNIAACKQAEAAATSAVTDCFQKQFQNLKDAMQTVQKDFDASVQGMAQYETIVNAEIQKEDTKQETLTGKIQTLGETKGKIEGLLAKIQGGISGNAKDPGSDTLAGMAIKVNEQSDLITKFNRHQKTERANRVGSCLQTNGAQNSGIRNCPNTNGDLLSPKDCILSIYRDSIALKLSGGNTRISATDNKKAEFAKKTFTNRLNQMMADFSGGNPKVGSADDFVARYGSELGSFGAAGQQMIQEIKNCDAEVQDEIQKDLANPESSLGSEATAMKQTAQQLASNLGGMINTLDGAVRDAGKEIFGQELNEAFNGAGCNSSAITSNAASGSQVSIQPTSLKAQLTCAQGLTANLQAMLNGTPTPGARVPLEVPLNVPGLDGSPARCKGLRDCLDVAGKLKATSQSRSKALKGEGTFTDSRCPGGCPGLKKFHTDSNNNIQAAYRQVSDLFQRRVALAKAQLGQVKAMLGDLDVTIPSKEPAKVSVNELCPKSSEKICEIPADFGSKIAGMAGLPDIKPEDFDKASKDSLDKKKRFAEQATEIKNNLTTLAQLKQACTKEDKAKTLAKGLAKVRNQFDAKLAQCKDEATELNQPEKKDFGANLEPLQADLRKTCENAEPDNTDCAKLQLDMSSAVSTCLKVYRGAVKQANRDNLSECNTEINSTKSANENSSQALADCLARKRDAMKAE
ncbi:MAG: hypothetical protein HY075_10195 [Deltaproteobacteria bacterium]|nr:hypothetical protein [Deltaproteobacteria bacterium]